MVHPTGNASKTWLRPHRYHLLTAALLAIVATVALSLSPEDAGATRENLLTDIHEEKTLLKENAAPELIQDTLQLPEDTHSLTDHSITDQSPASAPLQQQAYIPQQQPLTKPAIQQSPDITGHQATGTTPGSSPDNDTRDSVAERDAGTWHSATIKSGDSMALVFARLGFKPTQLHEIISLGKEVESLKKIKPGHTIRIRSSEENEILELRQVMSKTKSLEVVRNNDQLHASTITKPLEARRAYTTGTITQSLYLSAKKTGMSDNLIMELASIFGWDVDFALDIRKGDQFTVVYEEMFLDDKKIRDGRIIAAEFINQGKAHQAILFTSPKGDSNYFTPEGYSMRKAFLRSPVDFRRISSHFQRERWHPVLGKKRPHKGVDYAASTGTPIKAAGDGKITFRGRKGGYGRTIIVQHGSNITTLYAHMSSYKSGLSNGSRVKQGQTIGYVGKSGLATGPHLHYEFRVNGAHRNPLTVKLPHADPLPKIHQAEFRQLAQPLLTQLQLYKDSQLALQQ